MTKIRLIIGAAVALVSALAGIGAAGVAHASISDCSVSPSGTAGANAVCYSVTPGGNQYVVAMVGCVNNVSQAYRARAGNKASVLNTSHAACTIYERRISYWFTTAS